MAPVHEAAKAGDVEALRALLEADPGLLEAERETGVDVYAGLRPLHYACAAGSVEAVRLLLDRGAGIDRPNRVGYTPLMKACLFGRAEVVALLLARGADPTLRRWGSWTALMLASYGSQGSDHVAVIRLLLKDGRVAVDACDEYGWTALWKACVHGYTERARVLLVEGGADHTIVCGPLSGTLLAFAQRQGHHECVQLLQWYEGELERAFLLSKARAVVDDTESISKAAEKEEARTEAEAQQAREEAAPAYLCGRVGRGEALPVVEAVGQAEEEGEERRAVLEYVLRCLKEDLFVELMEMLRYR